MPADPHVEAIIKEIEATDVHMRVYFLDTNTNDKWEARTGGADEPGKTTPADSSIEFDPAKWDKLGMKFEGQTTATEIRIVAYDAKSDEEEKFHYAGALSGKLGTPNSTYGTVSNIKHNLDSNLIIMANRSGSAVISEPENQTLSAPI
jgi:hypothetical protein